MPPRISDRYRLEMRLGRDGDIEEWLATDTSLERPVLIRSLGPESSQARRAEFVAAVSAAAKVTHPHLARVFGVDIVDGGAYSISEWAGGATLSDRVRAGGSVDLEEFLPNAAGLAGALAALHASGAPHGHIDLSAISYSVAHPAKLGSFGRPQRTDERGDVRALSGALETAITGTSPGGPPPSESVDGFPRTLDHILRSGLSGNLNADDLQKAFLAAPTPRPPRPQSASASRRLLLIASLLVVVAVGLVALGRVFTGGGPILPVTPTSIVTGPRDTVTTTASTLIDHQVTLDAVNTHDPFGEGGENDDQLVNLVDNDPDTIWRTERYQAALGLIKPGVGLRFTVRGAPTTLSLVDLSPGTTFDLYWATTASPQLADWERVLGGQAPQGTTNLRLPARTDGQWLLWLTDLPPQTDGTFWSALAEVRFSS